MYGCLAACALLFCGVLSASAQEYDVVFHRPARTGQKSAFGVRMVQEQVSRLKTTHEKTASEKNMKIQAELGGLCVTTAVDKDKDESEFKLIVKFCTVLRNDEKMAVFEPDDEVLVRLHEAPKYVVNGSAAEGLQDIVLRMVFEAYGANDAQVDAAFAPEHKVKVGDTWAQNAKPLMKSISKAGLPVNADAVHGTVKLASADPVRGIPCLQLRTEMVLNSKNVTTLANIPKAKGKTFVFTIGSRCDLPQDAALPAMSQHFETKMESDTDEEKALNGEKAPAITHLVAAMEYSRTLLP